MLVTSHKILDGQHKCPLALYYASDSVYDIVWSVSLMQESVEGCGVVQTRLSHILLQHIIHQVRCLPSPSPPPAVLSFTSSFNNLNIDLDRSPSPSVVFHSYLVEAVTSYIRSAYVFLSPLSSLSLLPVYHSHPLFSPILLYPSFLSPPLSPYFLHVHIPSLPPQSWQCV